MPQPHMTSTSHTSAANFNFMLHETALPEPPSTSHYTSTTLPRPRVQPHMSSAPQQPHITSLHIESHMTATSHTSAANFNFMLHETALPEPPSTSHYTSTTLSRPRVQPHMSSAPQQPHITSLHIESHMTATSHTSAANFNFMLHETALPEPPSTSHYTSTTLPRPRVQPHMSSAPQQPHMTSLHIESHMTATSHTSAANFNFMLHETALPEPPSTSHYTSTTLPRPRVQPHMSSAPQQPHITSLHIESHMTATSHTSAANFNFMLHETALPEPPSTSHYTSTTLPRPRVQPHMSSAPQQPHITSLHIESHMTATSHTSAANFNFMLHETALPEPPSTSHYTSTTLPRPRVQPHMSSAPQQPHITSLHIESHMTATSHTSAANFNFMLHETALPEPPSTSHYTAPHYLDLTFNLTCLQHRSNPTLPLFTSNLT